MNVLAIGEEQKVIIDLLLAAVELQKFLTLGHLCKFDLFIQYLLCYLPLFPLYS